MEQTLTTNTIWLLLCTALVFMMQAGFCCLESGLSRSKNSINVAIKNVVDFCIGGFLFWLFGYALMFGDSLYGWIGASNFVFSDSTESKWPTSVFLFQMVFCGTAVTIASGVVAERMRFRAYIVLACVISGLIYPVFGHWTWGGLTSGETTGWLARLGFIDFAGATVVHSSGAWAALAAVILLGPRIGRFEKGQTARNFSGSNVQMTALGVFILWLGWLGFNGGSSLTFNSQVPTNILNTILAGISGGLGALLWQFVRSKHVAVESLLNGILAGLVGVTAGCNVVSHPAAVAIGLVAAFVMQGATYLLETRFKIDDVVGAISVHGFAGAWGTLAVALFAPATLFQPGVTRWEQIGIQLLGVIVCFAWSFGVSWGCLKLATKWISLRVTPEEEQQGLNVAEHGSTSDLFDLLQTMERNIQGDLSARASADLFAEAGMIAEQYNRVLDSEAAANQKAKELSAFGKILDRSLNEIYIFDAKTLHFLHVNHGARENIGYSMDECREMTPLDIKPEHTPASFATLVEPLLDGTEDNIEFMTLHRRKDGTEYPVQVHLETSVVGEKQVFAAVTLDITEQQQSEEILRKLSAAVEQSPTSILITDMEGKIEYVNSQFTKTTGYTEAEVIGANPRILNSGATPKETYADMWNSLKKGDVWQGEFFNKKKNGEQYCELATIAPIRNSDGIVTHFVALKEDITNKKEMETKLVEAKQQAELTNLELQAEIAERIQAEANLKETHRELLQVSRLAGMSEIATGVLHNVGNVLNSVNIVTTILTDRIRKSRVKGLAEAGNLVADHAEDMASFVAEHPQGQHLARYVVEISNALSSERGANLNDLEILGKHVDSLKQVVAMQQSQARIGGVREEVNPCDLFEDALLLHENSLEARHIEIVRDYEEIPPAFVEREKVVQILANLVGNGMQALSDARSTGHTLTVRVGLADDEHVRLEVADDAIGISADDLTNLFRFGFTTKEDGHGFGLHLSALAAKEIGGNLSVQSDGEGTGATFTLQFPLRQEAAVEAMA